jgi:hypothetical protein
MKNLESRIVFSFALIIFSLTGTAQQRGYGGIDLDTTNADGRAAIAIRIDDLPGQKFVLEMPEIFTLAQSKTGLFNYSRQQWKVSRKSADMVLKDDKYQYKIHLKRYKRKKSLGLLWGIKFTNNTVDTLYDLAAFNCWTMNFAPLFKDTTMERTFVNDAEGNNVALKNVRRMQGEGRRTMQFYPAVGGIADLKQSLWISQWAVIADQHLSGKKISVVSKDAQWLFENIVDGTVAYFFNNWEGDHGCVHASPLLATRLLPGESAEASGIFKFTKTKK